MAIFCLQPFEWAVRCPKYFEGWHSEKHHPYVGYGHKLLPGERFLARTMTKWDADILLRKDLRKFCAMFRQFGKNSMPLSRLPTMSVHTGFWVAERYPKAHWFENWRRVTGAFIGSISPSATTRENGTPCCSNEGRQSLHCCISHKKLTK